MDDRSGHSESAPLQDSLRTPPEALAPRLSQPQQISLARSQAASTSEENQLGGSFWSRNKTLVNFWLDALLLVLFLVIAWELAVLRFAFPKGASDHWRLLGHTAADWQDLVFNTFCVFAAGIMLHVMLHWQWIMVTIQTRMLHRKATRDDGSQTMIGVILLFVLIHLLAGGILWARWAIVELRL